MKRIGMRWLAAWLVVVVAGLASTFGYGWKPLLGLDLQGGLSVTLKPKSGKHYPSSSIEQAKQVIRDRVDGLGVAEPDVVRSGSTVVVQLPGLKDPARALDIIGTTAKLEFRPVLSVQAAPTSTTKSGATTTVPPTTVATSPTSAAPTGAAPTSAPVAKQSSMAPRGGARTGAVPSEVGGRGQTPSPSTTVAAPTTVPAAPTTAPQAVAPTQALPTPGPGQIVAAGENGEIYLLGPVGFEGTALSSAQAALNQGSWVVNVSVKGKDKAKANQAFNACYAHGPDCPALGTNSQTGAPSGLIAMVLDGKVLSAPTVGGLDLPGNPQGFTISGSFTHKSASDLALKLRYGSLPVEFEKASVEKVSATLGSSSLHAGLVAGAVGLILVAVYVLVFYRSLGLVAIASLMSSAGLLWVVISWLGTHRGLALTLSGITGIIVSIGVAVDSNIVFYEHLREDIDRGRTFRSTAVQSFDTAWRTILSADFVSLIGAAILYFFTIGSVRGFAFYLGLATILDLLASWLFMRPVVFAMARSRWFTDHPGILGLRPHRGSGEAKAPRGAAVAEAGA